MEDKTLRVLAVAVTDYLKFLEILSQDYEIQEEDDFSDLLLYMRQSMEKL